MKFLLPFFALVILAACGDAPEKATTKSEAIKAAEDVHEQALAVFSETADMLHDVLHRHQDVVAESVGLEEDDVNAILNIGLELERMHVELHDWEDNLTEVPGHEHSHDHDHGHEHTHDHAKDRILEGLSDEDHLAIQNEQLKLINDLRRRVAELAKKF